jgi:glycosyltransferase involved in cell wall biosynthesis
MLRSLPVVYVPHGADSPPGPQPLPERRSLLVVGRLWPYQGADLAVAAFERLGPAYEDATLVVAGKGPVGEELARATRPRVVVKPGYVPEDELMALLRDSTAVLLPYLDATQSGVGLQAVARGVPCVVSDTGALPDLVGAVAPELIAQPGDVDTLVTATERALDHDMALRERLFADAQARFAWPVVGEQLMGELRRLGFPVPARGR